MTIWAGLLVRGLGVIAFFLLPRHIFIGRIKRARDGGIGLFY
jgi:hypothetical protein